MDIIRFILNNYFDECHEVFLSSLCKNQLFLTVLFALVLVSSLWGTTVSASVRKRVRRSLDDFCCPYIFLTRKESINLTLRVREHYVMLK